MSTRYPKMYGKVGTIPMFIWLRSHKVFELGDIIEFRDIENGPWHRGLVTSISPLRLDRM